MMVADAAGSTKSCSSTSIVARRSLGARTRIYELHLAAFAVDDQEGRALDQVFQVLSGATGFNVNSVRDAIQLAHRPA